MPASTSSRRLLGRRKMVAGGWVVDLLGLPPSTAVGFVTGAMMANYTCLSAARGSVLARQCWEVSTHGLFGAPAARVLVGRHRHDAIDRAVRLLGLGQQSVVEVDADREGRIETAALRRALARSSSPAIVCLQAGEVHTGAFDPFGEAVSIAKEHGAWVHVDGAFGLWAAASPRYRALTAGMEGADSWATDAHKTHNVPYGSGLALVREPTDLAAVPQPSPRRLRPRLPQPHQLHRPQPPRDRRLQTLATPSIVMSR